MSPRAAVAAAPVATPINALIPPPRPRTFRVNSGAVLESPEAGPGLRPGCARSRLAAGALWCTFRSEKKGAASLVGGAQIAHRP